MKAMFLAMGAGVPALMLAMGVAIAGAGSEKAPMQMAAVATMPSTTTLLPLSQVENIPQRVATARVTDLHGTVVGAVQRVEIQNGRPTRVDIALLGSANLITLDAAVLQYDADANVVATGQSVAQLMARTQT